MESIIAAVLSGGTVAGVITAWFNYRAKYDTNQSDSYKYTIDFLKEDNERLRVDNSELHLDIVRLKERVTSLERTVTKYEHKIMLLESTHNYSPFPTWLKDMDGIMLSLNDAYEKVFLIPNGLSRSDYVGKNDIEVWGEEIGNRYMDNDQKALRSNNKVWVGTEPIKIGDDITEAEWQIIKYIRYAAGIKIGFAGKAIPKDLNLLNRF